MNQLKKGNWRIEENGNHLGDFYLANTVSGDYDYHTKQDLSDLRDILNKVLDNSASEGCASSKGILTPERWNQALPDFPVKTQKPQEEKDYECGYENCTAQDDLLPHDHGNDGNTYLKPPKEPVCFCGKLLKNHEDYLSSSKCKAEEPVKKPSQRIEEIRDELTDDGFEGEPIWHSYIVAIKMYLDELHKSGRIG